LALLLVVKLWEDNQGIFDGQSDQGNHFIEHNGTEYVLKDNIETFLVMGLDKFEGASSGDSYNNDKQADFIMLFVFDNDAKTCSAIHINRDTMANVNVLGLNGNKISSVKQQIALSHTYGNGRDVSCRNTADAVSELLLGIRVNHYISLTLDSVATFNDLVGGVEVTVLEDFTSIDAALVKGETVTLQGEQALTYVRTRYCVGDSTNGNRIERQNQYINALYAKTQQKMNEDANFAVEASVKMAEFIISDRSATQLQELAKKFNEYEFLGISTMEGENRMGEKFIEFYPDETALKALVIEKFYQEKRK
jgi:LCP family protein required for cell wall assembly